jgi:zinc finger HIT domain-containing protein 1
MINFGVREVANSGAAPAPGWAYVADNGVNASATALQPSSRKRARNQLPGHETTAQQDAKIQRYIASLQRDNFRDVSIPIPVQKRENSGRGAIVLLHFRDEILNETNSEPW